jgi:hypothetical protein
MRKFSPWVKNKFFHKEEVFFLIFSCLPWPNLKRETISGDKGVKTPGHTGIIGFSLFVKQLLAHLVHELHYQ